MKYGISTRDSQLMKGEESCTVKICAADFVKDYGVNLGFHLFQHINKINMEKQKIIVPKGIRYVGQENPETKERIWLDYDLNLYDFPHILNKKLTGCGFTEYCIKNKQKLILIRMT